jgi:hypothetical protein
MELSLAVLSGFIAALIAPSLYGFLLLLAVLLLIWAFHWPGFRHFPDSSAN